MPETPRSERKTQNRVIALFCPQQTAIGSVQTEMGKELVVTEQMRQKIRALRQGMMQELLTGRTRLV